MAYKNRDYLTCEQARRTRRNTMLGQVLGTSGPPLLDAEWNRTDLAETLIRKADDGYELMAMCRSERPVYGCLFREGTDMHGNQEYRVNIFGLDGEWVCHGHELMGLYTTDLEEADEYFQWALTEAEYEISYNGWREHTELLSEFPG